ncbi:precorrin-2 dehydrogenase/sirohydrochlorin ferrochelatase family protein [Alkalibacter saccharofermentans]|uniref:precorrin-2 dehydrogenase/sirohydrochlorin ferrochelatase family protein n=1 Tax=Alkalibacter saccharofermentans TaxID=235931 RepID=UPI000A04C753|nr:bifunctional precorrin-2 dehydrogenase/sirohydrochlorin ferrochelatase [Alkalibacter saccharofermentans]
MVSDMGYPVVLDLEGKKVGIIGGGKVALKKAEKLLGCGAVLYVKAQDMHQGFSKLEEIYQENLFLIRGSYTLEILDGCMLVFAATSNPELNEQIKRDCSSRNIFCNVVSDKDLSDFSNTAYFDRGKVQISVSTNGASPKIARDIKDYLEENFNPKWEADVIKYGRIRDFILKSKLKDAQKREKLKTLLDLKPEYWDFFFEAIRKEVHIDEN